MKKLWSSPWELPSSEGVWQVTVRSVDLKQSGDGIERPADLFQRLLENGPGGITSSSLGVLLRGVESEVHALGLHQLEFNAVPMISSERIAGVPGKFFPLWFSDSKSLPSGRVTSILLLRCLLSLLSTGEYDRAPLEGKVSYFFEILRLFFLGFVVDQLRVDGAARLQSKRARKPRKDVGGRSETKPGEQQAYARSLRSKGVDRSEAVKRICEKYSVGDRRARNVLLDIGWSGRASAGVNGTTG